MTAVRERMELLALLEQKDRERVSPKLEVFREPRRIKGCRGGRGAGAKSWSLASLLLQRGNYDRIHVACLREVQLTLEESVWKLLSETIARLGYSDWEITREHIDNPRSGSHFIFRGISDLRADQLKSLESFDIFWIEEAQSVKEHSLDVLLPTLRKPGSELWFSMNPEEERDPIIARLWDAGRDDTMLVDLRPGAEDNPWWTDELQTEMDADFRRDPDLAEHIWNGAPRVQGSRSVLSRKAIRAAMDRVLPLDPKAPIELGVDVARFGDDASVIYKRQGMKVTDCAKFQGMDTQEVARRAWDMAGRDRRVVIKVDDDGVGGGVVDKLRDMGASVVPVHNGTPAWDLSRFTTCADEQWFGLPIDEIDIPDDPDLMAELSGRQYSYTVKDQRKIESKADFKKRYGHSPDCFIAGTLVQTITGPVPIEMIRVGDVIITPLGNERVIQVWETEATTLVDVHFTNGQTLTGKPDHGVYTDYGFKPLAELQGHVVSCFSYGGMILWRLRKLWSTKARSISFKQVANIISRERLLRGRDYFTGESGLSTTGQYQKDTMSTIMMEIGAITLLAISRLFLGLSIFLRTCWPKCKTLISGNVPKLAYAKLSSRLSNGINQQKEGSGIRSTAREHGWTESQFALSVPRAEDHSMQHSKARNTAPRLVPTAISRLMEKQRNARASIAGKSFPITAPCRIKGIVADHVGLRRVGPTKTYNLTLERHNAYYANGILVENCADAVLLCFYRAQEPRIPDEYSAADLGL